ncbi:fimbrial protein [Enterobacter asburiae]|jgi:type 1 fimbria pilin|uniref:fimbrial protein n=1 Tax=Enterobacter asburiae TaxID=61645 RepID=UPI002B721FFE|nr:fimbrial protein [Enterobacter asburiae]
MNKQGYLYYQRIFKLMMAMLFLMHASAYASECRFGDRGEGGSSTIVNGTSSSAVYFLAFDGGTQMREIGGVYNASLSPALWSTCSGGNDGYGMENITYDAYGTGEYAVWPTNITGIYYAVRVYSDNNTGAWFTQSFGNWASLGVESKNESQDWKIQIKLFQSPEFTGNLNGATKITPQASKRIGGMSIGVHTDTNNQPWYFDVTTASFSIPVSAATCQVLTVNDGSNNVDFGETMFSSVRDGFYPRIPFYLQFRGCNNVVAVKMKISAAKTASNDNTLLGNTLTSNAAEGIGIYIGQSFTSTPSDLVVNDNTYQYVGFYNGDSNGSKDLQFYAYMRRDFSKALKAGNYKGLATFTVNYY